MFKKILIANRGEIAVRVARACHELGIATVGVYSNVDRNSFHLRCMEEIVWIGDSPPQASYLDIERIVEAAKDIGAQAIHPGYGFLAENASFAKACEDDGIVFIGPNSKALALVGDKVASRNTVKKIGVPIIPGMEGVTTEMHKFKKMAKEVGYPVIVKASLGGGGKGMRIIYDEKELEQNVAAGQREAKSAFGDETVYLEKYINKPRHIEFQVLRDNFGNVVHLYERECSIQRRHQKVIEESPSTALSEELRTEMGEAAKNVIKAADYTNAGTVEFMVDEKRNFYFLEMNTRLQVEHPVTELITGIDIVKEQLKIASGEKLLLKQDEIRMNGAAIECRISAEDPENNFAPSTGEIIEYKSPGGIGVRMDSGVYEGFEIPVYYDPLIAKLLVWAPTRQEAIVRMKRALGECTIRGIKTSIPFHILVLNNPKFVLGDYDTTFIDNVLGKIVYKKQYYDVAAISSVIGKILKKERTTVATAKREFGINPWKLANRLKMMKKI